MLTNTAASGLYVGVEQRLGNVGRTKFSALEHVKKHIDAFPRMESHYCHKSSQKLYLNASLSISELYRLYRSDFCVKNEVPDELIVQHKTFRRIFQKYDPPLGMYVPKKNQCSLCNQYEDATPDVKITLEDRYEAHKKREIDVSEKKKADMKSMNKNQRTIAFDWEATLTLPHAGDGEIYYKRKLSLYNFTFYDSQKNGYCYIWDEVNGCKGSDEIGTALFSYFMSIDTIVVNFMESGHSYLEADSMHSDIEFAERHEELYTVGEYRLIMESARHKREKSQHKKDVKPYEIRVTEFHEIFNLKELTSIFVKNINLDTNNGKVNWLK